MKLYKVLRSDLTSPYQGFQYEFGKEYVCEDFDDSGSECSKGFYATELEGLPHALRKGLKVFEVEVSGKNKKFNQYKWRWEKQIIVREVPEEELKNLLSKESEKVGYNLLEACYPINPFEIEAKEVTAKDIENLKKWDSIRDSIRDSVGDSIGESLGNSVGDSIGDSIGDSVGDSIRESTSNSVSDSVWDFVGNSVSDSVWDSVWGYSSSLFPNIKKWKYIDHEEGVNPFQPCIDLWRRGFVPSYDGNTWRLHSGKNVEIVYEINKSELS